jgi:predicted phage tail protein
VRVAVGVVACQNIEGLVVGIAMVVGVALSALAAPVLPWVASLGVSVILTGIDAIRAPRAWVYLHALHTADRTG